MKLRVASQNIGTMNEKDMDVVQMMIKRRIDVACVQETRWRGERAKELGEGYKIYYVGEKNGRNGVGVIVSNKFTDSVVEVKRSSSRLMKIKLVWNGILVKVVSAYAPQVKLSDEEKEKFWTEFDALVSEISGKEKLVVGGDLNGHVGRKSDGFSTVHGGWGYGRRNKEGETILGEAVAHGLVILNTLFKKKDGHLVTYESGDVKTQIDYIMTRTENKRNCVNCKVLPGEGEGQHKLVVADLLWKVTPHTKRSTNVDAIKWSKLREKEKELRESLVSRVDWRVEGNVEDMWGSVAGQVRKVCGEVLGVSKGGKTMISKETWWWEESVQSALKEKKLAFKEWKTLRTEELLSIYKKAKKASRRAVAISKAKKYDEVYEKLGTREGEKGIYKLAKSRARSQRDVGDVKCVRDENGEVLVKNEEVQDRWRRYFETWALMEYQRKFGRL